MRDFLCCGYDHKFRSWNKCIYLILCMFSLSFSFKSDVKLGREYILFPACRPQYFVSYFLEWTISRIKRVDTKHLLKKEKRNDIWMHHNRFCIAEYVWIIKYLHSLSSATCTGTEGFACISKWQQEGLLKLKCCEMNKLLEILGNISNRD